RASPDGVSALRSRAPGARVLSAAGPGVDFDANQIVVRGGKGDKDRITMLPAIVKADLVAHLEAVRAQHTEDLAAGAGLGSSSPPRWCGSTRTPGGSGSGTGSFPRPGSTVTGSPASSADTTCTSRCCSAR